MDGIQPLKWSNIVGYGLGEMANNFVFSMGMLFLLNYYTDVAGIGAAAAGTMLMVVRIYDAVMDVVAGRVIDRTGTSARWGRFRPYLLWGALPLLLLNVAVFSVPAGWGATDKLVYAYITYALLGTAYSFVNIPYGSLASVMTQVPRERSRLSAARSLVATSTIIFMALVLGPGLRNMHGEVLQTHLSRFTLMLAVAGLLLYFVCFISTREVVKRNVLRPTLKNSLSTLLANRPLHLLCLTALCLLVGTSSMGASAMYYTRYVLGDVKHFLTIILVTTVFGVLLAVPLAPGLVALVGKRGTFLLGVAIAAVAHLALFFVPTSSLPVILAVLATGSVGAMLAMIVMWALESDTVEYGEWQTGMRLEGMNYSFFSLARKCGQALGGSIPAFLLASSDYVPNLALQSPAVLRAIQFGVTLVPAIAFAAAFFIMLFYPLSDKRFLVLLQEIKARRFNHKDGCSRSLCSNHSHPS